MKILLDGDVLLYQTAHQSAHKYDWGDGRWSYVGDAKQAYERFLAFCHELVDQHPGGLIVMISGETRHGFRKKLFKDYKANREGNPYKKAPHHSDVRQLILESKDFDVRLEENLEADDLLGLLSTPEDLIVTIDKDLHTIPALHLNLRDIYKEPVRWGHAQSYRFFMKQALMGDSIDNIPGCKGVGPVTADKILADVPLTDMWEAVVSTYQKKMKMEREEAEEFALLNARLVRILQPGEYDFETKEVKLWQP